MKQVIHLFFLSVLLLSFAACGNDDNNSDDTSQATKTIFMYFPYTGPSNSLYTNFLRNIEDAKSGITKEDMYHHNIIIFISESTQKAHLINLKFSGNKCISDTVKAYSNPTFTTSDGIASILNDVYHYAPASTYAMIIGCHGEGWLPKSKIKKKTTTRFFGGTSSEYQTDITTLADAITATGKKMQFILFDDCYLSCVEVAYDLRNVTDYMIASTSEMMAYGMPYQLIMPDLLKDTPDYENVCSKFLSFYNSYSMPYGTLGITSCAHMDEMAALMKEINANHQLDDSLLDEIQDLDVSHWDPTVYFDFGDYVSKLCQNDSATLLKFNQLLQLLEPYKATTSQIYSAQGGETLDVKAYSGLTISDPSINADIATTKKNTNWWKATHE